MSALRRFLRLPRRSTARLRADLDEELRFYFDMRARELVEQGIPEREARREAEREFGDLDYTKRYCLAEDIMSARDDRRTDLLAELRQDVAHAWRGLGRSPAFAAVALATIALGIGANTAIFSVVNGVLLRELPYRDADQVVRIWGATTADPEQQGQVASANFLDLRARQRTLVSAGAFAWGGGTYIGAGDPVPLIGLRVDANAFATLGTPAMLGRTFVAGDDSAGAPPTVVLGYGVWRRVFGGDSAVVGTSIDLSGRRHTVIGVMPPAFFFPTTADAEIYTPLDLTPLLRDANRARKFRFLGVVGRLKPGVTVAQAQADLAAIARQLERDHPEANERSTVHTQRVRDAVVGDTRPALLVLFGASAVVLLIACANVAGMLLSRAVSRRRELAVRTALGAARPRLVRQMLTESVVLALAGGVIGVALAAWGTRALVAAAGRMLPTAGAIGIDWGVLLVTGLVTIGCGVLFGLAPALAASRDVHGVLRDGGRASSGGPGRHRLRTALVSGQLALAVMLLIGAGLLVRSLLNLHATDLGYSTTRVLTFGVSAPWQRYATRAAQDQFFEALFARLAAIPGVVAVGMSGNLPLQGSANASLAIDGRPQPSGSKLPEVGYQPVSDDWFRAMQVPLVRGRAFDARDHDDAPGVVIVSASLARRFWPSADPIGARVRLGPDPSQPWNTVVGVAGDIRRGVAGDAHPTAYVSTRQDHWGGGAVVVRATADPMSLLPAVRREVRALDPAIPVVEPRTMDEIHSLVLTDRRLPMQLMTAFAVLALVLSAVGVYGVMAYTVAARTREIGVRVALGALPRSVFVLVVRQGLFAAVVGLAIGVSGAVALAGLLSSLLYGVAPLDLGTFIAASGTLLVATLAACLIPARRALQVDPLVALRSE